MADWTPALLSGTVLARWFDASQNDVLVDNTEVNHWKDSSPNATNITAVGHSSNPKPTIQTLELDGKPVMRFLGNQYFDSEGSIGIPGDRFTVAFVVKRTNATGALSKDDYWTSRIPNDGAFSSHATGGSISITAYTQNGNNEHTIVYASNQDTNWHVHVEVFGRNQTIGSFDGTAQITSSFGTRNFNGATVANGLTIAWDRGPAGAGVPSFALEGDMAEFLVCGGAATAAFRQVLEGFLHHKYGLEANLPGGHPYAATAPQDNALTGQDLFFDFTRRHPARRFPLGGGPRRRELARP